MAGVEKVPACVDGSALEYIGEGQCRAVSRDESHQRITGVSEGSTNPEQPYIKQQY